MNLKDLADMAKELIGGRGGTESAKEDAEEVRGGPQGPGGPTDNAREAADAIKEPERTPGPREPEGGRDR